MPQMMTVDHKRANINILAIFSSLFINITIKKIQPSLQIYRDDYTRLMVLNIKPQPLSTQFKCTYFKLDQMLISLTDPFLNTPCSYSSNPATDHNTAT